MNKIKEMVLKGMHQNVHFSKALKSKYPDVYNMIMMNYLGSQTKEKIWNYCNDNNSIPLCSCGKLVKFSNTFKTGYNKFCSCKCAQRSSHVREACKKTTFERLGIEHNFASRDVIEAKKKTWLQKYGVDNPAKSPEINSKSMKTKIDRYGEEWLKTSFQRNMKSKYGVDSWVQIPKLYKKFSEKNSNKKYTLPSGREIHVQGYEPWALDILLLDIDENNINVHLDVPSIKYEMEGKIKIHYPDIFISSKNLLIDVKSGYTFKSAYEKNMMKAKSTVQQGFIYQFWIFDKDKKLEIKEFRPISNEAEGQ